MLITKKEEEIYIENIYTLSISKVMHVLTTS